MVKTTYRKLKHIHMIGIGGTGMNGIAEVLLNLGYKVTGSDVAANDATRRLARLKAGISIGHKPENVEGADVVVVSSAVKDDNVEVREARQPQDPDHPPGGDAGRADADEIRHRRGRLARQDDHDVHDRHDPRPGRVRPDDRRRRPPEHHRGQRQARRGRLLRGRGGRERQVLPLPLAVHRRPDQHRRRAPGPVQGRGGDQGDLHPLRQQGPVLLPVVLCLDDPNLQSLIPSLERRIITYGFSTQSDISARDMRFDGFSSVSPLFHKGRALGTLRLNVPGKHSILNAMASIAVGLDLDMPPALILEALESYAGTGRRFELKAEVRDIMVVEDYAHHPTEIRATLDAARRGWSRADRGRVPAAPLHPARPSAGRVRPSFNQADVLVLTEIYAAGEEPIPGVYGPGPLRGRPQFGHKDAHFEPDLEKVPAALLKIVRPGDIVIFLGAGNITKVVPEFVKKLEAAR